MTISRITGYTLAAVVAVVVVAGSVRATGQQSSIAPQPVTIDVMALHASANIASLPTLIVEEPF